MYRIISQYFKYFLLNSSNHPMTIAVRLKRMFNILWFEYFAIMLGIFIKCIIWNLIGDDFCCYIQILQSFDCQDLFWLKKQFGSIRILSVIWISFSGIDEICLFTIVKLHEGQNFVPCIRLGNKQGTKSGRIDTMLYYSCVFNVVIINIIEIGLFLLLLSIIRCVICW